MGDVCIVNPFLGSQKVPQCFLKNIKYNPSTAVDVYTLHGIFFHFKKFH